MLTYETAKAAEGCAFTIQAGLGPVLALVLTEVRLHQRRSPSVGRREPFSLLMKGTRGVLCPQGTYVLEGAGWGRLEAFIVPIGDDAETGEFLYQITFT